MKPYTDDAIDRYEDHPDTALLVIAIRAGIPTRRISGGEIPGWRNDARRVLNRAKAEMRAAS